ncbi:MAG TPA: N-acetyltransferase [Dehalococcoidia bacterium]|nr:N-acetyltransferase [Dehalococcoidia bacterium]
MLTIRRESASDREAVFRVERDAFGEDTEAQLVDALRDAGRVLLSLVAELDGEIVGHLMFTEMTVESDADVYQAVCLAPLAVATAHQRQGVGGALMRAGLERLREDGHGAVFLLGHPTYYPRFGFRPAREFDVHYEDDRDAFMGIELRPGALDDVSGQVRFAPEFDAFT